jgi:hypothetical protein
MANPLNHAQHSHSRLESQIKPYVAGIFPRLAFNYGLLVVLALIVSLILVPSLAQWIPQSTASTIGFCTNFLLLFFGLRYLENRNHATALFMLYTRYSRQRRDLEALMQQAQAKTLENMDALYSSVDSLEEVGKNFITAATDTGIQPKV